MKSESGSPTTKNTHTQALVTQSRWRIVGGVCIAVAGLMAWFGAASPSIRGSLVVFAVYWSVFAVVFMVAIAMVLLDLRYIRLQYQLGKREIFLDTLGDEEFRRVLKRELRDRQHDDPPESE